MVHGHPDRRGHRAHPRPIPVTPGEPDSPAFFPTAGKSAVWVLDYNGADGISRIDPATNRAVQVRESGGVNDLAAAVRTGARHGISRVRLGVRNCQNRAGR